MAYHIKCSYQTGDSFETEDAEVVLQMKWESLEAAKAALKRIEEHWRWYEYEEKRWCWESRNKEAPKQPKWHKELRQQWDGRPVSPAVLAVLLDNGKSVQFPAPWCGYFERLYGAKIITSDDDMSFTT